MHKDAQKAIILSGPSGSGKTTITNHLLSNNTDLGFAVSACTRAKRPQEIQGKDYYFTSVREFKHKIAQKAFVEWEEVYEDSYYGTLKTELADIWKMGKAVLFDTDVQGGLRLKSYLQKRALGIYVQVPSVQLLTERLKIRNTEREEELALRICKAKQEACFAAQFDVVLTNECLQTCLKNAQQLIDGFLKEKSV